MRKKKLITALSEISDRVVASKTTESVYFYIDSLCIRVSNHLTYSITPTVCIYSLDRGYVGFMTTGVTEQQYFHNVQEVVDFCLQLKKWSYLLLSKYTKPRIYTCIPEEELIEKTKWDEQLQCIRACKLKPFTELCDKLFTVAPSEFRKYLIYQLKSIGGKSWDDKYQILIRYIQKFDPSYEIFSS